MRRILSGVLLVVALVAVIAALRMQRTPPPKAGSELPTPPPYQPLTGPFRASTVEGRVVVGSAAAITLARVTLAESPARELGCPTPAAVAPGGGLADTALVITDMTRGAPPAPSSVDLQLAKCGFRPRVAIGAVGRAANVSVDGRGHRIQAWLGGVRVFDAAREGSTDVTLLDPGEWTIRCAAGHGWEQAWIVAVDHPYASVADATGAFRLPQVPVGRWTLTAFSPELGERTVPLVVTSAGGVTGVVVRY